MGRRSMCLRPEEKKERRRKHMWLYREKLFNIEYNITFFCQLCNKDIIIDPIREHRHCEIKHLKDCETILF